MCLPIWSVKSAHEVGVMKASADISARAHAKVRKEKLLLFRVCWLTFYLCFLVLVLFFGVDDAFGAAWVVRGRSTSTL